MLAPGDQVPDLVLTTPEGEPVRVGPGLGAALLVVYKRDCAACRVAIPRLPRLAQHCPGLALWAVSQDEPAATRAFLAEQAPSLPALVDAPHYRLSRALGVEAVPSFFLLDAGGRVLETLVGWDRERFNALGARAAALLGLPPRELVPPGDGPDHRPG